MALHAWNFKLLICDHKLKFKMYTMCESLSQINHLIYLFIQDSDQTNYMHPYVLPMIQL